MSVLSAVRMMLRRAKNPAPDIDAAQAARLRDEGAVVVDVREGFEHARSRIPGALHIPLGDVEKRLAELPTDKPVVVHCALGARSAKAADLMRERGIDAHNLGGGIRAWKSADLPVEE